MSKRRFYEGMVIDGKTIIEVHRNCAGSEYYLIFEDKTWKVIK